MKLTIIYGLIKSLSNYYFYELGVNSIRDKYESIKFLNNYYFYQLKFNSTIDNITKQGFYLLNWEILGEMQINFKSSQNKRNLEGCHGKNRETNGRIEIKFSYMGNYYK